MAKRHARGPGVLPPVRHGALLSTLLTVVVAISTVIYLGVASLGDDAQDTAAPPHHTRPRPATPASAGIWVSSWSAPPSGPEPRTEVSGIPDRTVRNVVHSTANGTSVRITLSNLYGQKPLTVTHATLGIAATPGTATAAPGTLRRLTFGSAPSVVIPAGAQVRSDSVRLSVAAGMDLLVSTYTPTPSGPVTSHVHARQVSYAARGDHTEDQDAAAFIEQIQSWRYLTALDVLSHDLDGTVVVVGDSLTDGITSTVGANRRWTDHLAARLSTEAGAPRYSVANAGISGNRILADGTGQPPANFSALNRFSRDVLGRSGTKAVVVALGVNDILRDPQHADADRIVDGLRELTFRSHARGLRVVGATLMPFGGHLGYQSRLEAIRETVNQQIRAGQVFDAVVDFDHALRDPSNPHRLLARYDSGDHLHPSDAGYLKMAEVFRPSDLKGAAAATL